MRTIEQRNKSFFNKLAKYYDSSLFRSLNKKFPEKIIKLVNIKPNSKILDAGCGTGNLLYLLLKQKKNLNLIGIDISPEMLKIAKRKLKGKTKFMLMPVEKINEKNKFDYIFSVDAFHHYSSQEKAMANFYMALKKNGKLIVVDFDFSFLFNKIFHWLEPGNSRMHSAIQMKEIFRKKGFRDIKQKKIGWFSWLTIGRK